MRTPRFFRPRNVAKLRLFFAASLFFGCLAHDGVDGSDEPAKPDSAPRDGLAKKKLDTTQSTEKWEMSARDDCEHLDTSDGCMRLYKLAAYRLRWGINPDDAAGLLVHTCTYEYPPGCAAVEALRSPTLDHIVALMHAGCPEPFSEEHCHPTASVLAYLCNERNQAAACVGMARILSHGELRHDAWAHHYLERGCTLGGLGCPATAPESPPEAAQGHAAAAE